MLCLQTGMIIGFLSTDLKEALVQILLLLQKKILIFIASQNVPRKNSIMLVGFDEISVLQASVFRYGDNETYGLKLLFGKCT